MKTKDESVYAPPETRLMRDETSPSNPRTIRDLQLRDVFVTHSRGTR
jgi:hypothetical protein